MSEKAGFNTNVSDALVAEGGRPTSGTMPDDAAYYTLVTRIQFYPARVLPQFALKDGWSSNTYQSITSGHLQIAYILLEAC